MSAGLRLLASIAENGSTTTFRLLEPAYLVDEEENNVYEFMRNHMRRYGELPTVETIEDEVHDRLPGTPERVDFYLDAVHNRFVYNGVRDEFGNLRSAVTGEDIPQMLQSANAIRRICTPFTGQQQELMTMHELAPLIGEEYDYQHATPGLAGIPTGWSYLDEETGGYRNGDFIAWVARPGVGKTHMMLHQSRMAHHAQKSVLVVSMEMTLKQMGMRYAAHEGDLDPYMVNRGRLSNFAKRRFDGALGRLRDAHNYHLYAGNFKKDTGDIDIVIQELGPDIVYIDGMYLMTPTNASPRMGRFERAAYLVDEIKQMALMRDRPIVGTTQFGRTAGKGGGQGSLENIGYTDAIGTHASIVLAIKQGKVEKKPIYHVSEEEDENGDREIINVGFREVSPHRVIEVIKGREGEAGTFGTNFKFGPTNFNEVGLEVAQARSNDDPAERPALDYMQ